MMILITPKTAQRICTARGFARTACFVGTVA
jgi:hypothetical protein